MAEIFDNKIITNAVAQYTTAEIHNLIGHGLPSKLQLSTGVRAGSRYNKRRRPSNPARQLKAQIRDDVANALLITANELVDETKALLLAKHGNGPAWTGELYDSIRRSAIVVGSDRVSVSFYADATNPDNGAMYAQFLEEGTGDQGDGTGPKWRYKGRDGKWYTTSGMKADPFLEPPIEGAKKRLAERCKGEILASFNPHWYNGSLQLWKDRGNTGGTMTNV